MKKLIVLGAAGALITALAVLRLFFWDRVMSIVYIKDMESAKRTARLQVERVADALALGPGESAADIGAGSGLFSRALARRLSPAGTLYAVDINPRLLDYIAKTARAAGLGNIVTVAAEDDDPNIPGPVDLIFLCDTLHMMDDKAAYLRGLHRYLKPGGRLAVIDLKDKWPLFHGGEKYTLAELRDWADRAGFRLAEEHDFLSREFFVIFERQPGA